MSRHSPVAVALSVAVVLMAAAPPAASDQVVLAGFDLYRTDPDVTYRDFSTCPIPADFFGPGSDPFEGQIALRGLPLGTSPYCPNDDLSLVDMIIARTADAYLPEIPSSQEVPIEILALSLQSVEPIEVTYFGGMSSELWDVEVVLSTAAISTGWMTIERTYLEGGVFDADYALYPLLIFNCPDLGSTVFLDLGAEGLADSLSAAEVPWEYMEEIPGSCRSNFCPHPGELALYASPTFTHGVYSVCAPGGGTVLPGFDLFETPEPASTYWDFMSEPIPADFFGPGSDPFDGVIALMGSPLGSSPHCPNDDLSEVDTIVERKGPSGAPVATEIVELSLVSTAPIVVTYYGGMEEELWEVSVGLSPETASLGLMDICLLDEFGGTFDHEYELAPRFTFFHEPDGRTYCFDPTARLFAAYAVPWTYADPPIGSCTSNFCPAPGAPIPYQASLAAQTVFSICPGPSGIDGHARSAVALYLAPPVPNPARGTVRIDYRVPGGSAAGLPVMLEILDPSGRCLVTLRDALHAPGEYSLRWSGTDAMGRPLPSGIYFTRLSVGGIQTAQRVMLIR